MMGNHIWIVNQHSYLPEMSGGNRHFEIAKELQKIGWKVTIFSSPFDHKRKKFVRNVRPLKSHLREKIEGIDWVWLNGISYSKNFGFKRILSMFLFGLIFLRVGRKFFQEQSPTVIIGSSPALPSAYFAAKLARKRNIPFLFEIRDLWPQTIVEMKPSLQKSRAVRFFYSLEAYCIKNASIIIGLLPGIPAYLKQRYHGMDEKFFHLPNGIKDADIEKSPELNDQVKIVMYSGALSPANSMESIFIAASGLPQFDFVIYGSGVDESKLKTLKEEMKISNVKMMGSVPKNQMRAKMKSADVFVANLKDSPLYKYGISLNKIFDYLGTGKPVVFGCDAFNDPVKESKGGISVRPESSKEMADAILEISQLSKEERIEIGKRGIDYVKKNNAFSILASRLDNQLKLILKDEKG